jgi:xanthine dehydrogenase accessory factor
MDSVDLTVLRRTSQWLEDGYPVSLVTVVKTWGSSPRPRGAMAAIRCDGHLVGSVSGGCVDDDLSERVRRDQLAANLPEVITYGVTREQSQRFGLPCGGTLQLVVEPLKDSQWLKPLLDAIEQRMIMMRTLDLETGEVLLAPAPPERELSFDGKTLITVHGPRWRLLIIGAGQVSQYLAQMALALDYQVSICDPREEYTSEWDIPGTELLRAMPDDVVTSLMPDRRTAIVALTHDPKLDDLALLEALKSDAFYVGAIGSKLNNDNRRSRLALFDITPEEITRLHGPVGLAIGSRTPPEIAISILAEMTAVRRGKLDVGI